MFQRISLCLLLIFLVPTAAHSKDFAIEQAQASLKQNTLSVDADFKLQLSDAVSEALHNGVSIRLLTTLDLFRQRPYIWDPRLERWSFTHQISYHSLTNRYVMSSSRLNDNRSYSSLSDLFSDIEHFSFQSDLSDDALPKSKHGYKLQLRILLDNTILPAPLRVMTYISPAWKLRSDIYEWSITRGP